jgi:modification methylase
MITPNNIICADVIKGLNEIDDNSVSLCINSPPYNVNATNWEYASSGDNLPYLQYIDWLSQVYKTCYSKLRKGGRLAINIDAMKNRQDDVDQEYIRDIRTDLSNELKKIGYKFYGEHVWYKSIKEPINFYCPHCKEKIENNPGEWAGSKTAWGSWKSCSFPSVQRNHEYVLIFSKEEFKLEKDNNSQDTDITREEFMNWISSVWCMQPETRKIGNHPVPFPEELPRRLIKLYSYPNDIILDCFNGIGTTTFIANQLNRRYIGIDVDKKYCDFASKRITNSVDLSDIFGA